MAEAAAAALAHQLVQRLLAGVPERRVAEIVAEPDRFDEILVQLQRPADAARDPGGLERVRQPCPEMVALRIDEDLRLEAQAAERLRVDDPVAVALERRPQPALLLGQVASPRLVGADGERRQPALLVLAHAAGEGVGNFPGKLGHLRASLARAPDAAQCPAQRMIGTVPPSALHAAPVT